MDNVYFLVGVVITWTVIAAAGIALLGLLIAAGYGAVTAWRAAALWVGFRVLDHLTQGDRETLNTRIEGACEDTGFLPDESFYKMIEKLSKKEVV